MDKRQIFKKEIEIQFPKLQAEMNEKLKAWRKITDNGGKICMFGMGLMGRSCLKYMSQMNVHVDLCVDNNPERHEILEADIEVLFPNVLESYNSNVLCVVAAGSHFHDEIIKQCEQYGVKNVLIEKNMDFTLEAMLMVTQSDLCELQEKIFQCIDLLDEESLPILMKHFEECFGMRFTDNIEWNHLNNEMQYFLKDANFLDENEIVVECGAFIGDSIEKLVTTYGTRVFDKIDNYYCYELNVDNFEQLKRNIRELAVVQEKIVAINKGIGRKPDICYYTVQANCTKATENGQYEGRIVCLDDEFAMNRVTMIKMDIEGSEIEAILGAKTVLGRDKPKCAICTYHSVHELWEIPLLLHSIVPEYRMFLRHHSDKWQETVCYAYV